MENTNIFINLLTLILTSLSFELSYSLSEHRESIFVSVLLVFRSRFLSNRACLRPAYISALGWLSNSKFVRSIHCRWMLEIIVKAPYGRP